MRMDPIAEAPATPDGDARAALVLQNGRHRGTRRPLETPLTLLGRSSACDVQIHLDGIESIHCAIVDGPEGYVLRDLGGGLGTIVNEERVHCCRLGDGDRIGIGPFLFVLELPEARVAAESGVDVERGALRVQAAAVAAQQAAFDDEEQRLQQQHVALDRQQKQLAAHLEERRRKLHELREELKAEREQLQADRAAVEQERTTAADLKAEAEKDRRRLAELREKLERRQERRLAEQEAMLRKQEQELVTEREKVRGEAEGLKRDRAELHAMRLRFNGEAELSRRELGEGWEQLALAQQKWEETLNQEQRDRARRAKELGERSRSVTVAEQALADERRRWERRRLDLEKEAAGLDVRIRNLRDRLPRDDGKRDRIGPPPLREAVAPAVSVALPEDPAPECIQRLAGTLADQRLHLLEQWRALLTLSAQWHQEHEAVQAMVEEAGGRLEERDRCLTEREQSLQPREEMLHRREEGLTQIRLSLEGWQLRLTTDVVAWEAERYTLLTELQGREAVVARQMQLLETLRRRWVRRRRQEVQRQREFETRCEEVRRQYIDRWEACLIRDAELNRAQRAVAAGEAALERYRLECIGQAPDVVAAEKRIERLRRQEEELFAAADKALERDQQAVLDENARVDARAEELQRFADEVAVEEERCARRRAAREARQVAVEGESQRRRLELRRLRLRHQQEAQQLVELRAELERVAGILIDGNEAPVPLALPSPKAA
jgi:pSer/pThr/pTyr-binding forkhead associated (FHA) protein